MDEKKVTFDLESTYEDKTKKDAKPVSVKKTNLTKGTLKTTITFMSVDSRPGAAGFQGPTEANKNCTITTNLGGAWYTSGWFWFFFALVAIAIAVAAYCLCCKSSGDDEYDVEQAF